MDFIMSCWIMKIFLLWICGYLVSCLPAPNPQIVEHPDPVTFVSKNSPATLHCQAEGDPSPVITWYRDGQKVLTDRDDIHSHRLLVDGGNLFFLYFQLEDEENKPKDVGVYYCNATNIHGSVTSRNTTVQIAELEPDFQEIPKNTTVEVGKSVVLPCAPPIGHPTPWVMWQKNGQTFQPNIRVRIEEGDLVISNAQKVDSGSYRCVAYNKAGERKSPLAKLAVLEHPKFKEAPSDVAVDEGETVKLKCQANPGSDARIQWRRDHGNIPFGRATVLKNGDLNIENIHLEDDGMYVCIAVNDVGAVEGVARLSVHSKPTFVVTPVDKIVAVGNTVTLKCVVSGNPPPSVYWSKGPGDTQGLMFPNRKTGRFSVASDGTFTIENVSFEDEGDYFCNTLNTLGRAAVSARIFVRDKVDVPQVNDNEKIPPVIVRGPQNITLLEKGLAFLPCEATGDPLPMIQWFKNDQPLSTDSRTMFLASGTLQITGLRFDDAGRYTCKARSGRQETSWTAYLKIESASNPSARISPNPKPTDFPGPPQKPTVMSVTDKTIKLSWNQPVHSGASPITGYMVEISNPEDNNGWVLAGDDIIKTTFVVEGLSPNKGYRLIVRGRNQYGLGLPSPPTDLIYTEQRSLTKSGKPDKPLVYRIEDNVIRVQWSPRPRDSRQRSIIGYVISCWDEDFKHNCTVSTNRSVSQVDIKELHYGATYNIKIAAKTKRGLGEWSKTFIIGTEQVSIMKEPWFIGILIGTIGGTLWVALCIFSVWLCMKKKQRKKKMLQNRMYNVPVHQPKEIASGEKMLAPDMYSEKENNATENNYQPEMTNLLEGKVKDENIYNTAWSSFPEMKTFCQKPNPLPNVNQLQSVAPYATTPLINANKMAQSQTQAPESNAFHPNHGYVHNDSSGSGHSRQKLDCHSHSSDSNTDGSHGGGPGGYYSDNMTSPASDGSCNADDTGYLIRQSYDRPKGVKQPMMNVKDMLPPQSVHLPPINVSNMPDPALNIYYGDMQMDRLDTNRSPVSPVSKISACSCPLPHNRVMSPVIHNVPYSDTEHNPDSPRIPGACQHFNARHYNDLRTQTLQRDSRSQPSGSLHSCNFPHHSPSSQIGGCPQQRVHQNKDHINCDCYCMNQGHPTCVHSGCVQCVNNNNTENSLMDRACQSSLPSVTSDQLHSPVCPTRLDVQQSKNRMNISMGGYRRNAGSPISDGDYADESELDQCRDESMAPSWASTDHSDTGRSSVHSSISSSSDDGSFLAEADFASAIARAAELSGLTTLGNKGVDPNNTDIPSYKKPPFPVSQNDKNNTGQKPSINLAKDIV